MTVQMSSFDMYSRWLMYIGNSLEYMSSKRPILKWAHCWILVLYGEHVHYVF